MFCSSCGTQLPDDASFCYKCGTATTLGGGQPDLQPSDVPAASFRNEQIIAPAGASLLKCPSCGAPIAPKFGEMVITCEYCGSGVTLGNQGWTGIQKQSMLALKVSSVDEVNSIIIPMMNKGLLHRHLHEDSTQEEMNLSYIPYWIVSVWRNKYPENSTCNSGQLFSQSVLRFFPLGIMLLKNLWHSGFDVSCY